MLLDAGYAVCGTAATAAAALEIARRGRPDLAVVDVRLAGGGDGIRLAEALAASGPISILFATGTPEQVRRRARVGHGCLCKPFDSGSLLAALEAIQGGSTAIPGYFPLPYTLTL